MSVTVEQPTEGRLQDGQSMLDLGMVTCNVVRASSRVEALESSSVKDALTSSSDTMSASFNI